MLAGSPGLGLSLAASSAHLQASGLEAWHTESRSRHSRKECSEPKQRLPHSKQGPLRELQCRKLQSPMADSEALSTESSEDCAPPLVGVCRESRGLQSAKKEFP